MAVKVPDACFPSLPLFTIMLGCGPTQPTLLKTVRMVIMMTVMMN